jgi:hypothetical protein
VLETVVEVLVAVLLPAAVNVRLGVLVAVFVVVGLAVRVRVGVFDGSTKAVPNCVGVDDCNLTLIALAVGVSGVAVHNSGRDCGDAVKVGTTSVATGVAGGNGLMKVYGLTKILINTVDIARPASITIEANMSQNDSFIASIL